MAAEPCSLKALRSFLASSGLLGFWQPSASRHITFLLPFTISRRWSQAAPSTLSLEITSAKWSGSSLTSSTFHPTVEQAVSPGNSEPRVWLTSFLKRPVVSHSSQERWRDDQTLCLAFWARFRSFTITPNNKCNFWTFWCDCRHMEEKLPTWQT